MKTAIVVAMAIFMVFSVVYAEPDHESTEPENNSDNVLIEKCPTKGLVKDCMTCHTKPNFKIRESDPFEGREPPYGMYKYYEGEVVGYYKLDTIWVSQLQEFFEYFDRQEDINTVMIEVDSYGGSMFEMWGVAGIMERYYDRFHVITFCKTTAFSAGLISFAAGEERLVTPHSQLMWHEVAYFSFLKKNFPSGLEEEADMMRKWQGQGDAYIASKCDLSADEISEKVSFKEWWFNGEEAIEIGLATGWYVEPILPTVAKSGDEGR